MSDPLSAVAVAVAKALYGPDADPREVYKAMPDPSALHLNGNLVTKPNTQGQGAMGNTTPNGASAGGKAAAGGLLFGSAAETLATASAAKKAFPGGASNKVLKPLVRAGEAIDKLPPKVQLPVQAANLGLGLLAARELLKKPKQPAQPGQPVAKAFRLKPINAVVVRRTVSLRAKRPSVVKFAAAPGAASFDPMTGVRLGANQNPTPVPPGTLPLFDTQTGEKVPRTTRIPKAPKATVGKALVPRKVALWRIARRSEMAGRKVDEMKAQANLTFRPGGRHAAPGSARHSVARSAVPRPIRYTVAAGGGALGLEAYQRHQRRNPVLKAELTKFDEERHLAFGWASLARVNGQDVIDLQGDYIPIEEIEKAAYDYVRNSRVGGKMHQRISKLDGGPLHVADLVESFVSTPEKLVAMGLAPDALPHGWFVGFHVPDETDWQEVKKYRGFSVHGSGQRTALIGKSARRNAEVAGTAGAATVAATSYPTSRKLRGMARRDWQAGKLSSKGEQLLGMPPGISRQLQNRAIGRATRAIQLRRIGHLGVAGATLGTAALAAEHHHRRTQAAMEKGLRERARQAAHPPRVALRPVDSTAIARMGYQPQTRRLAVEMHSRLGRPYAYRASPKQAKAALDARSKGSYYTREVKGALPRKTTGARGDRLPNGGKPLGITPLDRARLFAHPERSR